MQTTRIENYCTIRQTQQLELKTNPTKSDTDDGFARHSRAPVILRSSNSTH